MQLFVSTSFYGCYFILKYFNETITKVHFNKERRISFWHLLSVLLSVPTVSACSRTCQNGGTVSAVTCMCDCADGYSGDTCGSEYNYVTLILVGYIRSISIADSDSIVSNQNLVFSHLQRQQHVLQSTTGLIMEAVRIHYIFIEYMSLNLYFCHCE